ncbi:MAG: hypothetical protein HYY30_03305 [Chloroflexi bacterium]|nr:hypothetical protein [Chloroflexota bacterium]
MLEGGLLRGSTTFVAGPAGSGKTILGLHFLFDGVVRAEPGLLISFQENPTMIRRTVAGLGWGVSEMGEGGLLTHLYVSPVEMNIDDIVERATSISEARGIRRLVVDSLLDLEASSVDRNRFRSYAYALMQYLAVRSITTYFTYETSVGADYSRLTDLHLSYLSDNVFALRYEPNDEIRRTIAVVKSRGSAHVQRIVPFIIGDRGVIVDAPRPQPQKGRKP